MTAMLDTQNKVDKEDNNENKTMSNSTTSKPQISAPTRGNWSRDEIYETALLSNLKLLSRNVRI